MIRVGVNENVVISKAEINDKGTLFINVREAGAAAKEGKKVSLLEGLEEGSDTTGSSGDTAFLLYCPKAESYDDPNTPEDPLVILRNFTDLKNQLAHLLLRFTTKANVKFSPFAGVAVNLSDDADILAKIALQANIDKVYHNYATQFIRQITPFLNKDDKPSRLFLHRKSVASHYGVLRKKFLGDQPFFEDGAIPVNLSALYTKQTGATTKHFDPIEIDGVKYVPKFSKYELEKFLDNPERTEEAADDPSTPTGEIEAAGSLFTAGAGAGDDSAAEPGIFQIGE